MNPNEWEEVSVNNAPKLDLAAARAKQKEKDAIKTPKPTAPKAAPKKDTLTKAQIAELTKMKQQEEDQAEDKLRASAFAKWEAYARRFPEHIPSNARSITPNSSLQTIQGGINALKQSLTAESSHEAAKLLVENMCGLFEYLTMDQQINPFGLNVRGLKKAVHWEINQQDSHFEPEVSEMSIELAGWLTGPWYARLIRKMGETAIQMNTHNKEKLTGIGNETYTPVPNSPRSET